MVGIHMKTFKQFLSESQVNSHMTHLSDLVFISGVDGTRKAVNYLRDMRKMFGHTTNNVYSTKWDGAPAVVLGIDPSDGKFFVAKKGIFNKNPIVYKTQKDIDNALSGELKDKFSIMLKYLPTLGIKSGIFQGDLMYVSSDLKTEVIDGDSMLVFHPNTIAYAVPVESDLAKKIKASKLGIVFHTTYTGNSFDALRAEFGENITSKFNATSSVWATDATLDNETSKFTLSDEEYMTSEFLLKDIGVQFQRIPSNLLNRIAKDEELSSLVLIYINSLVRKNVKDLDPKIMAKEFYEFIDARYKREIEKRKTVKAQSALDEKRLKALEFFNEYNHAQLASVFELAKSIDVLKDLLLSKMRDVGGVKHFLKTKDGFKITNPEGFVAINSSSGEAIKLVDRFVFSQANFSSDILKGWSK